MILQVCVQHESGLDAAEKDRVARERHVETVFEALDSDGRGTIDLDEFCQLSRTTGLARSALRAIFTRRDADGSGALDLEEFRQLVDETRLLEHMDAIVDHAERRRTELRGRQEHCAGWDMNYQPSPLPSTSPSPSPSYSPSPSLSPSSRKGRAVADRSTA